MKRAAKIAKTIAKNRLKTFFRVAEKKKMETQNKDLKDLWERGDLDGLARALQRQGYGQLNRVLVPLDIIGLTGYDAYASRTRQLYALERWVRGRTILCPYCGEQRVAAIQTMDDGWSCLECDSTWDIWGKPFERRDS